MTLAGIDGRPGPFSRATFWWWAGALLAIYLVVLADRGADPGLTGDLDGGAVRRVR